VGNGGKSVELGLYQRAEGKGWRLYFLLQTGGKQIYVGGTQTGGGDKDRGGETCEVAGDLHTLRLEPIM